jgi:hypothetical protein
MGVAVRGQLSNHFGPTVWLLKLPEEMSEPVGDGLCKIVLGT